MLSIEQNNVLAFLLDFLGVDQTSHVNPNVSLLKSFDLSSDEGLN